LNTKIINEHNIFIKYRLINWENRLCKREHCSVGDFL